MKIAFALGTLALLSTACSSKSSGSNPAGATSDSGPGGSANAGGSSSGGSTGNGGMTSNGGSGGGTTVPGPWAAGNPDGSCKAGVPSGGKPADVSNPTTVVGTGTADSCTFDALNTAVGKGGVITFNCGGAATIGITATLKVPTDKDTVIDGGKLVTLDGQSSHQIMSFDSPGWQTNEHRLTLQHLRLINAKETGTDAIPTAPAPCSQGFDDGQGGAVYMRDGNLTVIDSIFTGNQAAPRGPDTGGGAIYVQGSKHAVLIVGSTFEQNAAANAGAVGGLFAELDIYDSLFDKNTATGDGANNNDPSKCSVMNNGQNEIGSGGNGGAIYSDGIDVNITLCGDKIVQNAAGQGAFGGGLFFTSNNFAGTLSIADTTMTDNTGGHWTNVKSGSVTDIGTAVGTNCQSITLQNSTIQGVP